MRYVRGSVLAGSFAAMVSLLLTGCGGVIDHDDDPIPPKRGKGGGKATTQAGPTMESVKGDYKGVIRGKVVWDDSLPDLSAATKQFVQTMRAHPQDGAYCTSGSPLEQQQQAYRIGDNKGLGNVFVWISVPYGQVFDVPDEQLTGIPKVVLISQPHCVFLPHCATVFAARYKGGKKDPTPPQILVVQNDAKTLHNANVQGGPIQTVFGDQALSAWTDTKQSPRRADFTLKPDEEVVKIRCGVHAWMLAYVRPFDHPYHAVTSVGANLKDAAKPIWEDPRSKEFGTFVIKGVPIGATVTLRAWHEDLGEIYSKEITLEKDNEITINAKKK